MDTKKLYKNSQDKVLAGVCSGIAEYLNMDVTIIRVIWAVLSVITVGTGVLGYLIFMLVLPEKPQV